MPLTKALTGLKITNADEGRIEAVFATFNVKDHDGDVTLPGAFTEGEPVRISVYNHGSWRPGALPVGKGIVKVIGNDAVLDGQFFLNTTAGRDTFETVKEMGDLQEWSYGYDTLDSECGTKDGEQVRFLKKQKVHEVSPVLLGAGIDTRTLSVKGKEGKQLNSDIRERLQTAGVDKLGSDTTRVWLVDYDMDEGSAIFEVLTTSSEDGVRDEDYVRVPFLRGVNGDVMIGDTQEEVERNTEWVTAPADGKNTEPEGVKLTDQIGQVKADTEKVTARLTDVKAQRAEKGKGLGDESVTATEQLADELETAVKTLREVLASADTKSTSRLTLEDETRLTEAQLRVSA